MDTSRTFAVVHKEWREILRDPLSLTLAFVMPVALMLLIGFGMIMDVTNVPFAVIDRDHTASSREYASRFIASHQFDFKGYLPDEPAATPLLMDGKLRVVIIIPEQFERLLLTGRPASVQVLLDGVHSDRTRIIKGYVSAMTAAASTESLVAYLASAHGMPAEQARRTLQPFSVETRYLYNAELNGYWSLAPKLIMFILFFTPAFMTSLRVVREKEFGTIFNIYTSPLTRMEFLTGKLTPHVAIALVNVLILWGLVMWVFDVPFRGSVPVFLGASTLYVIATTCVGMLVSVFVRTQVAAMVISLFIAFVPALQYSGLASPVASMGPERQVIAHLTPAMHYNRVIDGVFLKGTGLTVLWPELLLLAVYAGALLGASYVLFHKRVQT